MLMRIKLAFSDYIYIETCQYLCAVLRNTAFNADVLHNSCRKWGRPTMEGLATLVSFHLFLFRFYLMEVL